MTDAEAPAVFAIHRLVPSEQVAHACRMHALRRAIILSTHHLFQPERADLSEAVKPTELEFVDFADLFDDAGLAAIDAATSEELHRDRPRWGHFADHFAERMVARRNSAAIARLQTSRQPRLLFAADGLGLDFRAWRSTGARRLHPSNRHTRWQRSAVRTIAADLYRRWLRRPRQAAILNDGETRYVFIGSLRRLSIAAGTKVVPVRLPAAGARHLGDFAAVALHDYTRSVQDLGLPVRVFVDSYLPSNYPRTYLDAYEGCEFVCPDLFSARWLDLHGLRVVVPPRFVELQAFRTAVGMPALRTVVLLLNHSGDWSALIHRSDTDLLVEAFAEVAHRHTDLSFVVRPHPGMNHWRHEGPGGCARLESFVRSLGLPNLTCSNLPLAEDLERGDLFVSEYSATLIDAWRKGKPGLALNLTRRRSFMADFTALGFAEVASIDALSNLIAETRATPAGFASRQSEAAARYNALPHPARCVP
jgi:hypothetical protein